MDISMTDQFFSRNTEPPCGPQEPFFQRITNKALPKSTPSRNLDRLWKNPCFPLVLEPTAGINILHQRQR